MKHTRTFPVNISINDLVGSLDMVPYGDKLQFILSIDLQQGDAGFTEELILSLCKSLANDYTKEEWDSLLNDISKIKK